jgi:predicted small secreted protein
MNRAVALLLALVALMLAGCGGTSGSGDDARQALAGVKPIASARVDAVLSIDLDNAPRDVGDRLELRFAGPLRSNGAGRLPSLDWKLAFTGLGTAFSSRLVSTGNNVFIRLGGADFAVGEATVARLNESSGQAAGKDGLSAIGLDPLAAIKNVKERGKGSVAGTPTTQYTGAIDLDKVLDQIEAFLRKVPQQATAGQPAPQLQLTAQQRKQVAQTFRAPAFEADVAKDKTIRRLALKTRFVTRAANRAAAGGITGGTIEYRLQYSDVGVAVTIPPVQGARPIEEFNAALQRELAK